MDDDTMDLLKDKASDTSDSPKDNQPQHTAVVGQPDGLGTQCTISQPSVPGGIPKALNWSGQPLHGASVAATHSSLGARLPSSGRGRGILFTTTSTIPSSALIENDENVPGASRRRVSTCASESCFSVTQTETSKMADSMLSKEAPVRANTQRSPITQNDDGSENKWSQDTKPGIGYTDTAHNSLNSDGVDIKHPCGKESSTDDEKSVLVQGILGLNKEILELFFENKKKCDGGDIESIEISEEDDEAIIVYCDPGVAERVLKRGPTFNIGSQRLTVERPPKPDPNSILVQGLQETMSKDILELFFENKKRSSGGDIDNIQYEEGSDSAVIRFVDAEVTQQVLSRKDLVLEGSRLTVSPVTCKQEMVSGSACDKSPGESNPRVIHVSGIPPTMNEDILTLWFESKKHGGGEIESVDLDSENGTAIITYVEEEGAKRMLERGTLKANEAELTLSYPKGSQEVHLPQASALSVKRVNRPFVHTIQIMDVPKISETYLKLALEKEASAKVELIMMYPERSSVVVRFKNPKAVSKILQKKSVTLEKHECRIIPLYTEVHDKIQGTLAVMVTGLNKDINCELLQMYFSNRRKNGGFGIQSIFMKSEEGKAVITFESVDAVKSVIGMSKTKPHLLKKTKLNVEQMEPLPPPPLVDEPTEPNKLIMLEAPPVSKEELQLFLCDKSKEKKEDVHDDNSSIMISSLQYGWKNNVILIDFSAKPNYKLMLTICASKPLNDKMVSLEKVSLPRMIQVRAGQRLDEEDLELYFESKRSGGAPIEDVTMLEDDRCAVIDYGDNNVVKSVLQKQHKVEDITLSVDVYYPTFGICPYNYDSSQAWNTVPEPFSYKTRWPFVWKFLSFQPSAWELLSDVGAHFGFEPLPEKCTDSELYICYKESGDGSVPDAKEWKELCEGELDDLCGSIASESIAIINEYFEKILNKTKTDIPGINNILLDVDVNHFLVSLTGWEPEIRSIAEKAKCYVKELEEEMTRQNRSVEEKLKLEYYALTMIRVKQFHRELAEKFPKLKVRYASGCLCLIGLPSEINPAKLYVYENVVSQIQSITCQCSVEKIQFLQKKKAKSFIVSEFQKAKIIVVFETKDSQFILHAMTEEELQTGQDIIQKAIKEQIINLRKENISVVEGVGWNALKMKFKNSYGDICLLIEDITNQRIQLFVTADKCDILLEEIHNFLIENTVIQQQIDVEQPVIELIRMFYQDEIKTIEKNFVRYMLSIGVTGQSFIVRGTEMGLKPALQALQDLCDKVVSKDHVISRPGMEKFFNSERGQHAVRSLEMTNKVICVEPRYIKSVAQNEQSYGPEASSRSLCTGKISGGPVVKVFIGDITKHRVDAIVNAANGKLEHIGGLAAAIVSAGGDTIEAECSKYMRDKSELVPGEVFVSSSGRLPCKRVIHAVGPRWQGGDKGEQNELFEAVFASLKKAERHKMASVAIPILSSGVFSFPMNEAVKVICEAVVDYFQQNQSSAINEVHLIDNKETGGSCFAEAVKTHFSDGAKRHSLHKDDLLAALLPEEELVDEATTATIPSVNSQLSADATPDTIKTKQAISITIKRNSLADEQVDVLVNTTKSNLHLNGGGVSSVLLKQAGPVIQKECDTNKPSAMKPGDVVVTSGGNLKVKHIFHSFCREWDENIAVKDLEAFVSNALEKASQIGCTSIAFPAIGTGILKYPRDVVARVMLEKILSFGEKNPETTLKDIRLALISSDTATIKAFEDHWKSVISFQRPRTRKLKMQGKPENLQFIVHEDISGHFVGKIGRMKITVKKGDITKEDTDVIMNSTDARFNKGAVFKAIVQAGGAEIEKKCIDLLNSQGPLVKAAMTDAGNLPCKRILHVNAAASGTDWDDLLFTALKLVDDNRLKSIALPALGTGTLHKSGHDMSEIILSAITAFVLERTPVNLEHVCIVLFDKKLYKDFMDHVMSIFNIKGSSIIAKARKYFTRLIKGDQDQLDEKMNYQVPEITYRIYALDASDISRAIGAFQALCRDETGRHIFDGEEEQELISHLRAEDRQEIMRLRMKYDVTISIHGKERKSIIVDGCQMKLTPCVAEITKILNRIQKEKEEEHLKSLFFKQVHWQFQNGLIFDTYPPEINYIIEKAYLNGEKKVTWEEDVGKVELFIEEKKERQNNDPRTDIPVQRTVISASEM